MPGNDPIQATIEDISPDSLLLQTNVAVPDGTQVAVDLPGPGGAVSGMVIQTKDGGMSISFASDDATRTRVANVIEAMSNALIVNPPVAA